MALNTWMEAFIFGIAVGIIVAVGCWIITDREKRKAHREWVTKMEDALMGSDFCEVGCGYYEQCFNRYDNREIAMDMLYHNYCFECPIRMATDLLEKGE